MIGVWRSALTDDRAVFHRHARVLVDTLRVHVRPGDRAVLVGFQRDNPGDSAIFVATLMLMRALGVEIEASVTWAEGPSAIPALLERETRVVMKGGGNFGDIYVRIQRQRLETLAASRGHLVVQLPQSISFSEDANAARAMDAIVLHGNVVLCARDHQSADRAAEIGLNSLLVPDTVSMLTADPAAPDASATPILWLARTDVESAHPPTGSEAGVEIHDWEVIPAEDVSGLLRVPGRLPAAVARRLRIESRWATRLRARSAIGAHRSVTLLQSEQALAQIARYRVVITDRLHGHLIACLARRPNVILDNIDGKVDAYFATWTEELGIAVRASSAGEALQLATELAS